MTRSNPTSPSGAVHRSCTVPESCTAIGHFDWASGQNPTRFMKTLVKANARAQVGIGVELSRRSDADPEEPTSEEFGLQLRSKRAR